MGCDEGLLTEMPVLPEIFHLEQPLVGGLGIGQKVSRRAAVEEALLHQEAAKVALAHAQLLGRGPDIGAVAGAHKGVVKIRFRPQPLYLPGKTPVFLMLCQKLVRKGEQDLRCLAASSSREGVM